ncbi:MAG: DNA gyrase inhibitor YacG [Pseudomonadota bacterium]
MSCPICHEDMVKEYRPFCSRRCADIDLSRWMTGGYAMPSEREEDQTPPEDAAPTAH